MRNYKYTSRLMCVGAVALLTATACTQDGDAGNGDELEPDGATGTIRGPLNDDPTTFHPAQASSLSDYQLARLGYDSVLRSDDEGGVVGGLASEFEQSQDGIELTIRDDAYCADGTQITPTVVADSLAHLSDPETGAPQFRQIFGSGEVNVSADDEANTVTVELSEPYSELAQGLTHPASGIVCPAGLDDPEGVDQGQVPDAFSGPYSMTNATSGVEYEFEFNDGYDQWPGWSQGLEGNPAQTLTFVPGVLDTSPNQVITGEMDWTPIEHYDVDRFPEDEWNYSQGATGAYFVIFNTNGVFGDFEAREAAAQVLDREAFQQVVDPTSELIAATADEGVQCANDDESYLVEPDPNAAAEVLDGADIDIISTNVIGANGSGGEYLQDVLSSTGANVDLNNADVGTWLDVVMSPEEANNWDLTIWSTVNVAGLTVNGLSRVVGPNIDEEGGSSFTYYDNPEASAAYDQALQAEDLDEACGYFQEAEQLTLEEVLFVPLTDDPNVVVSREGVTVEHIAGREDLSTLRLHD